MKHQLSWSVFENLDEIPGTGDLRGRIEALGLDGLELFTLFQPVDPGYAVPEVTSVHLPYAIDWVSAWEGREYEGEPEDVRYFSFGKTREEMVSTLAYGISCAAAVNPSYGVLHAGNTDMRTVMETTHEGRDSYVIGIMAELLNRVAATFPGGEPPFRIALENLWWDGLKLKNPSEWRVLEDKLEFDNWGFVLDTGHLMNTSWDSVDEESAIDVVLDTVGRYPSDMLDRIGTVHLVLSTTANERRGFSHEPRRDDESFQDFMNRAGERATATDEHRPYSSRRAGEILDAVRPDFVTHELYGRSTGDRFGELKQQRALLFRWPFRVLLDVFRLFQVFLYRVPIGSMRNIRWHVLKRPSTGFWTSPSA